MFVWVCFFFAFFPRLYVFGFVLFFYRTKNKYNECTLYISLNISVSFTGARLNRQIKYTHSQSITQVQVKVAMIKHTHATIAET